jgi:hypothetical protein
MLKACFYLTLCLSLALTTQAALASDCPASKLREILQKELRSEERVPVQLAGKGEESVDFPRRGSPYDPYWTGLSRRTSTIGPAPAGLKFNPLAEIQIQKTKLEEISPIVTEPNEIRLANEIELSFPNSSCGLECTSIAGEGNSSVAYFYDPEVPDKVMKDATKRKAWIEENARYVIKTRKPGRGVAVMKAHMEREITTFQMLDQLTRSATLRGRPFIRPARFVSDSAAHGRGILIQEAIHGQSAADISEAIEVLVYRRGFSSGTQVKKAIKTLRDAKVIQRNVIGARERAMMSEMREKLDAVEEFYRSVHRDFIKTTSDLGMPQHTNWTRGKFPDPNAPPGPYAILAKPVGLDLKQGLNLNWDPATQEFVIVDW